MGNAIALKRSACHLAQSILRSDEGFLDKVVELSNIGNAIHGECWDTEFHVFGVIESETDHLPLDGVRKYCSHKMLERSDQEIKDVIAFYKRDVVRACNDILSKYKSV
jgi:hypothetical protein